MNMKHIFEKKNNNKKLITIAEQRNYLFFLRHILVILVLDCPWNIQSYNLYLFHHEVHIKFINTLNI